MSQRVTSLNLSKTELLVFKKKIYQLKKGENKNKNGNILAKGRILKKNEGKKRKGGIEIERRKREKKRGIITD